MSPPTIYVMCTAATGPSGERRPAGVIHAAPQTHPPVNTSFCGQSGGLYWFGHLDFWTVTTGTRCEDCIAIIGERAVGDSNDLWTYGDPSRYVDGKVTRATPDTSTEPPPP